MPFDTDNFLSVTNGGFLEVTRINRIYRVNTNKLAAKYNRALLIVNLPSIAAVLTLLAVTLINDGKPLTIFNYKVNFYILTAAVAVAFFTSLFSAVLTNPVLKGHSKETYIEICGGDMVISQFVESAKCEGRHLCYKKLWIIKMADIEDVFYTGRYIVISGKARLFTERSDRLRYSRTENGIEFEHWWYNENGGQTLDYIQFRDYYPHGKWLTRRIFNTSEKYKAQQERRRKFNDRMMNIYKKVKSEK